ncbi:unnamed protein product [Spirodela intermedia]|uniref:Endopeptidase S2P n=1 Tax=Spirodela intermedia TaxID=51605 RepID=A0A7I8JP64_SPIIN|nr:unnamed protein product [Spirodela intermedia]CAA6671555.1 unnamed protein product [Spirodela intermedia]
MPGQRRARRSRRSQAVLPLHSRTRLSHTISCWYCDLKISAFNGFLFALGSRHAKYLRVWFTMGVGASFMALAVITMILLQQLACTLQLCGGSARFYNLPLSWLLGIPSWASGLSLLSLMDAGVMIFSTLVSVLIHEFGHAIAAASQGVQIEYIALFLSVIFPGALVAFNYNVLLALPPFTALRIYCAGIWHNTVFCAVCGLALLSLPALLYPFYIHGERAMVLSVSPVSPLAGYLSPGDIIMSLNDLDIHNPEEWFEKVAHLDTQLQNRSYYSGYSNGSSRNGKGYCVPNSWIEERGILSTDGEIACPDGLVAFKTMPCCRHFLDGKDCDDIYRNSTRRDYCFPPQDVVKLKNDECCLAPVQSPHSIWAEVSFARPYFSDCLKVGRNETSMHVKGLDSGSTPCLETFIFIGDISVANSIKLSAYQPRWALGAFGVYLPNLMEKVLISMFRVSASLGLLNCMPVFYLDGESMLDVSLCCITRLDPRSRRRLLRVLLTGGTLLFVTALARVFFGIYSGNV